MLSGWQLKCCLFAVVLLGSQLAIASAEAQWSPAAARPVRTLDRWLGVGYSGGYHWRNPGPNTDYYQPYSDLNSGWGYQWDAPSEIAAPKAVSAAGPVKPGPRSAAGEFSSSSAPAFRSSAGSLFGGWPAGKPDFQPRTAGRGNSDGAWR